MSIHPHSETVSFGEGSQMGEVRINDIAGRDVNKIEINIITPSNTSNTSAGRVRKKRTSIKSLEELRRVIDGSEKVIVDSEGAIHFPESVPASDESASSESVSPIHLNVETLLPSPPRQGEYLKWLIPNRYRNEMLGDLEEEYAIVHHRFGEQKANRWYYAQLGLSLIPLLDGAIERICKLALLTWASKVLRRFIQ